MLKMIKPLLVTGVVFGGLLLARFAKGDSDNVPGEGVGTGAGNKATDTSNDKASPLRRDPSQVLVNPFGTPPPAMVSLQRPTQILTTGNVIADHVDVRLRPSPTAELVSPNDAIKGRSVLVHQTGLAEQNGDCDRCEWWLVTTPGGATGFARVLDPNNTITIFDDRLHYQQH